MLTCIRHNIYVLGKGDQMENYSLGGARNLLIVDDHCLIQMALTGLLTPLLSGGTITLAGSGQEAMAHLREGRRFHLILLDLKLPDCDGLRLLANVRREAPNVPVAIFTGQDAPIYRQFAREAGVQGFLSKTLDASTLTSGIRALLAGRLFFDDVAKRTAAEVLPDAGRPKQPPKFSLKQESVLNCLLEGNSNKEIAYRLDLSERTVKMHLTTIYTVLGVSSRSQAILAARGLPLRACTVEA